MDTPTPDTHYISAFPKFNIIDGTVETVCGRWVPYGTHSHREPTCPKCREWFASLEVVDNNSAQA